MKQRASSVRHFHAPLERGVSSADDAPGADRRASDPRLDLHGVAVDVVVADAYNPSRDAYRSACHSLRRVSCVSSLRTSSLDGGRSRSSRSSSRPSRGVSSARVISIAARFKSASASLSIFFSLARSRATLASSPRVCVFVFVCVCVFPPDDDVASARPAPKCSARINFAFASDTFSRNARVRRLRASRCSAAFSATPSAFASASSSSSPASDPAGVSPILSTLGVGNEDRGGGGGIKPRAAAFFAVVVSRFTRRAVSSASRAAESFASASPLSASIVARSAPRSSSSSIDFFAESRSARDARASASSAARSAAAFAAVAAACVGEAIGQSNVLPVKR